LPAARIRIGIGGWTFAPWRGVFYPDGLPHAQELAYAGTHLGTIEINSTFYGQPRAAVSLGWVRRTPPDFEFSVKLFQKFTHPATALDTTPISSSDVDTFKGGIEPLALAAGSQVGAAFILAPGLAAWPGAESFGAGIVASVLALALVCTAFAYLIYFRLIANVGAARALTVTLLIPVFGVLFGVVLLGESVSPIMLAGAALVIGATWLVVGETQVSAETAR